SMYVIDSNEGSWNSSRLEPGGNTGYKIPHQQGYFPVAPVDANEDVRDVMCQYLAQVGLDVERAHHEVGAGGQQEINYRFNS
ncbi:glutamine synthetase, partial [Streptococcus anginosus]|nr:glutamine synthetase [Streptococcus anginosus]